jgi:hypothetical protein
LAPPPAKRFTAASIAWSRLTTSNLIDATLQPNAKHPFKLKNFEP